MNKDILIIGGMGPQASILLHKKIIDRAIANGAQSGSDFPAITHISIPVPEFIDNPEDVKRALKVIKEHLVRVGGHEFTHCVISCNTAHLFLDEISKVINGKFVSLIKEMAIAVQDSHISKVGILASPTTLKTKLLESVIDAEVITLSAQEQDKTSEIIHGVIAGRQNSELMLSQTNQLLALGADKVILGCTELSVLNQNVNSTQVIDPLQLVANKLMPNKGR